MPSRVIALFPINSNDALVCGLSSQLHQQVPNFDELITHQDSDFSASGLIADSVIRLGFLAVIPHNKLIGAIGSIALGLRLLEQNASRHD